MRAGEALRLWGAPRMRANRHGLIRRETGGCRYCTAPVCAWRAGEIHTVEMIQLYSCTAVCAHNRMSNVNIHFEYFTVHCMVQSNTAKLVPAAAPAVFALS